MAVLHCLFLKWTWFNVMSELPKENPRGNLLGGFMCLLGAKRNKSDAAAASDNDDDNDDDEITPIWFWYSDKSAQDRNFTIYFI